MKHIIFLSLILLFSNSMAQTTSNKLIASCCSDEEGRKCTGSAYCTACTNCSGCKHCSNGGTCGVCDSRTGHKKNASESSNSTKSKSNNSRSYYKGEKIIVTNATINLRKGPGTSFEIVSKLKAGDELIYIERSAEWIKVKVKKSGIEGWVYGKYIN